MKLIEFLSKYTVTPEEFADKIGVSRYSVDRYARHERIPDKKIMSRIISATKGTVTANDFYAK